MNWLFPPESSKYVTILRNPVDHFESTFNILSLPLTITNWVERLVSELTPSIRWKIF